MVWEMHHYRMLPLDSEGQYEREATQSQVSHCNHSSAELTDTLQQKSFMVLQGNAENRKFIPAEDKQSTLLIRLPRRPSPVLQHFLLDNRMAKKLIHIHEYTWFHFRLCYNHGHTATTTSSWEKVRNDGSSHIDSCHKIFTAAHTVQVYLHMTSMTIFTHYTIYHYWVYLDNYNHGIAILQFLHQTTADYQ